MRVLITGGTGFLGQHVARALLARGDAVRLMGRDFSTAQALLDAGAERAAVDLRDRAAVVAACAGADIVCHAGAFSAPWGSRGAFFGANVAGTAAVIAGCRAHGVRRLVYISSPAVNFTGRDHVNLTEAAPYPRRFTSLYALTKKLGEDLVNAATDVPSVTLRPKAIFGPGDRALLPRLLDAARAGRLVIVGDGRNQVDLTYVDNVVHAILLTFTAEAAVGKTYFITNGEHVLLWDLLKAVLREKGLPTDLRRVPLPVVWAFSTLLEWRAALTGIEPPFTRYSAALLGLTQTYDITAAQRDLGYAPVVSVAEGVWRTLATL